MRYTKEDIIKALKESGIKSNDTVFFTTSLGMVGIPPSNIDSEEKLNRLFLDAIKEVITDGNILVPTYSYTFGKSTASEPAIFDLKRTPSEIGPFPNYILKQKGVIRSKDPFVSVACIGKDAQTIFDGISNNSYGAGCFFEKMLSLPNVKCCSIGLGPNWTPFIHYADWLVKAPHRYDKQFYGYIKYYDGRLEYTKWIYYVRFLGDESYPTAHKIGRLAEKEGIWKSAKLGRARVYAADYKEYFDFVMQHLKKDRWLLAKGPAIDVEKKERERIKDLKDIELDPSYKVIALKKTGKYFGKWLVPERWTCQKAILIDDKGNTLSTTPYLYSLSIDKVVTKEELLKHISPTMKNVYENRDWGFVYDGELKSKKYKVLIQSSFGYGTIKIVGKDNKIYALLANSLEHIDDKI